MSHATALRVKYIELVERINSVHRGRVKIYPSVWAWWLALILGGLVVLSEGVASPAPYHPGRILIKPRADCTRQIRQFHTGAGCRLLRELSALGGLQVISLPAGRTVEAAVRHYAKSGLVEFAEPDLRLELAAVPNDPRYLDGTLWALHNTGQNGGKVDADIDAPEAWDITTGDTNIVVAIIDSGMRLSHLDLAQNLWVNPDEIPDNGVDDDNNGYVDDVHGINTTSAGAAPVDLIGHGTQVAGLVGAIGDNAQGGTGVAWRTRLMICRFTDDAGNVFMSEAAEAINYARSKGAHIINASFINTVYSPSLYTAINACRAAGIIVVAAAGNSGLNIDLTPFYPASFSLDNIVTVAATTRADELASFSNYGGATVQLAAPGVEMFSTDFAGDDAYAVNSGTSFSAPLVAGALALLRSVYPDAPYRLLIDQLCASADRLPSLAGRCTSGGRLNIARALNPLVEARFATSASSGGTPFRVSFTNQTAGIPVAWQWNFGDGDTSRELNPVHTYTYPGTYAASLTVTGRLGSVSTAQRVINLVAGYQITNTPFAWVDPSEMPSLNLTGESVSGAQPLPFPFLFYGDVYTNVYVGANGILSFEAQALPGFNTDLPSAGPPNNLIAPFWDDFTPLPGSVHFGIDGVAPNRRAVISWIDADAGLGPHVSYSFQVLLEESHEIIFQYLEVNPGSRNSSAAGRSATIGLEHRSGLIANRYSYNGSAYLLNSQSIRFAPSCPSFISTNPPPDPVVLFNPSWLNGFFSFSFTSQVGRVYQFQTADVMDPGGTNWQTLSTIIGNGDVITVIPPQPAASQRFHRLEAR